MIKKNLSEGENVPVQKESSYTFGWAEPNLVTNPYIVGTRWGYSLVYDNIGTGWYAFMVFAVFWRPKDVFVDS